MSKTKFGKDLLLLNCMLSDLLPLAPKQNSTDPLLHCLRIFPKELYISDVKETIFIAHQKLRMLQK